MMICRLLDSPIPLRFLFLTGYSGVVFLLGLATPHRLKQSKNYIPYKTKSQSFGWRYLLLHAR